jgi:hypothetical protein
VSKTSRSVVQRPRYVEFFQPLYNVVLAAAGLRHSRAPGRTGPYLTHLTFRAHVSTH